MAAGPKSVATQILGGENGTTGAGPDGWWAPRSGHTVTLEPANPHNGMTRTLYLVGGALADNSSAQPFSDEVWSWRPDVEGDIWRRDFGEDALFSSGDGSEFRIANNSPIIRYVNPDADLSYLRRFRTPAKVDSITGKRLEERPFLTQDKLDSKSIFLF